MHMIEISSVPSGGVSSPSLPLEDVQGAEEEYVFLLMECLRATIEGKRMREREREREGGGRELEEESILPKQNSRYDGRECFGLGQRPHQNIWILTSKKCLH